MSSPITVLGAGLMGRLISLSLALRGYRVEMHEAAHRDAQGSAAFVAAAMLAPLAESVVSDPLIVSLGLDSLGRWPSILASLSSPVFFQKKGTLVLWHSQDRDQADVFTSHLGRLDGFLSDNDRPIEVDAQTICDMEPSLDRRFQRGIYLPGEGQLDNRALLDGLVEQLEALDVLIHWGSKLSLEDAGTGWVIDCRGMGAKHDWSSLRGVRGEVLRVHSPDVHLKRPIRLLHPRYPIYIAPKPNGVYVVGATQIESEDTSKVSVRSSLELLSALYTIHPAFGEARILEMLAQCRPALPDNRPSIQWNRQKVMQINGLYRHGFMIAPSIVEATLSLFERVREETPFDWESWRGGQAWPSLFSLSSTA